MTVRQVLAAMLVALGSWTLIDSPALARSAESSQLGARRSVALGILHPIRRVDAALGLDRLSHLVDDLRGRRRPPHAPAPPAARPAAPAPRTPVTTPALPPTLPPLRIPTATNPLRVLVIGDSLGLSFGQSLAAKLDASHMVTTTVDAREGTGLSRPDAFDWPAQLAADLAHFHPEVVVASFGGNDDQDVIVNGRYITFGSPRWAQVYQSRVAAIAGEAHGARARLVWSGLPVMRSPAKTARLSTVMGVTRTALTGRDGALWVDNLATLAGRDGHYAAALPDGAGQQVLVREPDGIHESRAGADILAARAMTAMATSWKLDLRGAPGQL